MADKLADSAFSHKFFAFIVTLINQLDTHTGVEERKLPQALGQNVVNKFNMSKNFGTGLKPNRSTALIRAAHHRQGRLGFAHSVFLLIALLVTVNGEQQIF